MKHPAPIAAAVLALTLPPLASCSPTEEPAASEETADIAVSRPPELPGPAAGEDRPEPVVPLELTRAEWRGLNLEGELGCAFARHSGDAPLFFATGIVGMERAAEGALKLGEGPIKLVMDRPGGFDALSEGGRFTGDDGVFAEIAVNGDEPLVETPQIAMESPQYRATLTVGRDGQSLAVDGIWECGP